MQVLWLQDEAIIIIVITFITSLMHWNSYQDLYPGSKFLLLRIQEVGIIIHIAVLL